MKAKHLKHRPSSLTVAGIYARHICSKLDADRDAVVPGLDTVPAGGFLEIDLTWGALSVGRDPAWWVDIDEAAGRELGGAVTTTVTGDIARVDAAKQDSMQ
jgi:hypothetical protein